jgi:hypothetical protein
VGAVDAVGTIWANHVGEQVLETLQGREIRLDSGDPFEFAEVASRCRGRVDIRHRFGCDPAIKRLLAEVSHCANVGHTNKRLVGSCL